MSEYNYYIKKPYVVKAKKMDKPFKVNTLEGVMQGKKGDYLVEGIEGEQYICDGDIFEKTYVNVIDKNNNAFNYIILNDSNNTKLPLEVLINMFSVIDTYNSILILYSLDGETVKHISVDYDDISKLEKDLDMLLKILDGE